MNEQGKATGDKLVADTKLWTKNCLRIQRQRNVLVNALKQLSATLEEDHLIHDQCKTKYQTIINEALGSVIQ